MNSSFENMLYNIRGIADEIRSMSATVEEVNAVLERIASRPVVCVCLEIQTQFLKDLEKYCSPTCDCCCYFQGQPPPS